MRDRRRNSVVELSWREIHSVWRLSEKLVWRSLIYPKRKIFVSVAEMTDVFQMFNINTDLLEQMILNDDKVSTDDLARCFVTSEVISLSRCSDIMMTSQAAWQ